MNGPVDVASFKVLAGSGDQVGQAARLGTHEGRLLRRVTVEAGDDQGAPIMEKARRRCDWIAGELSTTRASAPRRQ